MEGILKTGKSEVENHLEHIFDDNGEEKKDDAMKCQQIDQIVTDSNNFENSEKDADDSINICNIATNGHNILQFLEIMTQSAFEENITDFLDQDLEDMNDDIVDNTKQFKDVDDSVLNDTRCDIIEEISEEIIVATNINQIKQAERNSILGHSRDSLKEQISHEKSVSDNIQLYKQGDMSDLDIIDENKEMSNIKICTNEIFLDKNGEESENRQDDKTILEENGTELNVQNFDIEIDFGEDLSCDITGEYIEPNLITDKRMYQELFEIENQKLSKTNNDRQFIDEYLDFVDLQAKEKINVKTAIDMLVKLYTTTRSEWTSGSDQIVNKESNGNYDQCTESTSNSPLDKTKKKFCCVICSKSVTGEEKLKVHLYAHILDNLLLCHLCWKRFYNRNSLEDHIKLFHKPYQCDLCSKCFSVKKTLVKHVKKHLFGQQIGCNFCLFYFKDKADLREHMLKEHNENFESWQDKCENHTKGFPILHYSELPELNANEKHPELISTENLVNKIHENACEKNLSQKESADTNIESHSYTIPEQAYSKYPVQKIKELVSDETQQTVLKPTSSQEITSQAIDESNSNTTIKLASNDNGEIHSQKLKNQSPNEYGLKDVALLKVNESEETRPNAGESNRCTVCNKVFKMRHYLQRHMILHQNYNPYTCLLCKRGFKRSDTLKTHVANVHKKKSFQCDLCQKTFGLKRNLGIHKFNHCLSKRSCWFCGKKYKKRKDVLEHAKKDHPEELKFCKKKLFEESKNLFEGNVPIPDEDNADVNQVNDAADNEKYKSDKSLQNVKSSDKIDVIDLKEINVAKNSCKVYVEHISDDIERPKIKDNFLQNIDTSDNTNASETSKKSKIHKCSVCFKVFSNRSCLQRHISLHLNRHRFWCSTCGKSFPRNTCLQIHCLRYHPRKKCLSCGLCEKKFATQQMLENHERSHSYMRGFLCCKCGITYKNKNDFINHVKKKHVDECRAGMESMLDSEKAIAGLLKENLMKQKIVEKIGIDVTDQEIFVKEDYSYVVESLTEKNKKLKKSSVAEGKQLGNSIKREYIAIKKSRSLLNRQSNAEAESDSVSCRICNKCFSSKGNLRRHMAIHRDKMPFICSVCGRGFSRSDCLNMHMISMHDTEKKLFECELFKKTFASFKGLKRHRERHSSARNFQCKVCMKKFKANCDLKKHLKRIHPKTEVTPYTQKVTENSDKTLQVLGVYKTKDDKSSNNCLNNEENENMKPEGIVDDVVIPNDKGTDCCQVQSRHDIDEDCCPEADSVSKKKGTKLKTSIKIFESVDSQEGADTDVSLSCSVCKKVYAFQSGLKRHMVSHGEILPFSCSVCDKRFPRKDALHLHSISAHGGKKQFECEKCNKTFATKIYLKNHMRRHSSVKQFPCQFCEKSSKTRCDLSKHVKRKHPEKLKKPIK